MNQVILLGRVGKEPEIRDIEQGVQVSNFTVATSDPGYTNSQGVQVPERTEWHNIVAYKGLAKASKYLHKGDQVFIVGKMRTRSYEDQGGVKRFITEVFADKLEFGARNQQTQQAPAPAPQPQYAPQQQYAPQYQQQPAYQQAPQQFAQQPQAQQDPLFNNI